ncbi:tyrosine-type recombinase/integrase [Magnetospirillum sp. ME-1]|uniref:tyrosine-type recombinase/integrase n=1 Tax=Magnetospirillum sp. ME-1 TaxID=1639348 RepID=UPI000A18C082|nr:site-specific integrase [Magnetospirillum sp. ME-1]
MKSQLSQAFAESVKPTEKREYYWDLDIPGFGLLVLPSGRKSWLYQSKLKGSRTDKRITLGTFPIMEFTKARGDAIKYAGVVQNGGNHAVEKEEEAIRCSTVKDVFEFYIKMGKMKPQTRKNVTAHCENHVYSKLGSMRYFDLTKPYFIRWLEANFKDAPGTAYNLILHTRSAYNFARGRGAIPAETVNPAAAVVREGGLTISLKKTAGYAMAMEDAELTDLLNAIREAYNHRDFNPINVAMIELILSTGARKGEILSLRFDEIDLEKRTITKINHKTSETSLMPRTIYLSDHALSVLDRAAEARKTMRRISSEWVFPATRGRGHSSDANRPVTAIGNLCGFPSLKPHNLRSLYINVAIDSGVPLPVVSQNVGHSTVDTTLKHYLKNKKSSLLEGANGVGIKLASLAQMDD